MAKDQHHGVSNQSQASLRRRQDAEVLFQSGFWQGAMYRGGYAVECLLKAALMRQFGCRTLAELEQVLHDGGLIAAEATMYTHQFEALSQVGDHFDRLRANVQIWPRFRIVNCWQPAWRYASSAVGQKEAKVSLESLDLVIAWIHGNI